jgi:hypothetical protein
LFGHDIQYIAGFRADIGLVEIEESTFFVADANNRNGKAYSRNSAWGDLKVLLDFRG